MDQLEQGQYKNTVILSGPIVKDTATNFKEDLDDNEKALEVSKLIIEQKLKIKDCDYSNAYFLKSKRWFRMLRLAILFFAFLF